MKQSKVILAFFFVLSVFFANFLHAETSIAWNLEYIEIEGAWKITQGDPDVVVAVIDSGIDFSHFELKHAQWINEDEIANNGIDDDDNGFIDDTAGWDFTSDDNHPGPDPEDPIHWHATFISGIIAAANDTNSVTGIAPNVSIMDLRVLDKDNFQATAALGGAIYYAVDNGADVINLSLQYYSNSSFLYEEIKYAYDHNVPIVSITGNMDVSQGGGAEIPSFPGAYNETITVGALNYYLEKADYSNYGVWTELVAPVGDQEYDSLDHLIYSTYPGDSFVYGIGTSFAAPQVTATIALMKSVNPDLTIEQIRTILHETAIDLGEPGWDKYYGYGMINATAAVQQALALKTTEHTNTEPTPFPYSIGIASLVLWLIPLLLKKKLKLKEKILRT